MLALKSSPVWVDSMRKRGAPAAATEATICPGKAAPTQRRPVSSKNRIAKSLFPDQGDKKL